MNKLRNIKLTRRSYAPSGPLRYRAVTPVSQMTVTVLGPKWFKSDESITVPAWPSPPSWSPYFQSGPRTTLNPFSGDISNETYKSKNKNSNY